jgi:hypothetical protein
MKRGTLILPFDKVHPAMFSHPPSLAIIENWMSTHCQRRRVAIERNRIAGALSSIRNLGAWLSELHIPYQAFPIVNFRDQEIIREVHAFADTHEGSAVVDKTLIVPQEIAREAADLLDRLAPKKFCHKAALGCLWLCDEPDRPRLTSEPITIFHEDGSCIAGCLCRSCVSDSLRASVSAYFEDGKTDIDQLKALIAKPAMIATVDCNAGENGERWPVLPMGLLLHALARDSEEMAQLVEAWLMGVFYHAMHTARDVIAFCPDHPRSLFVIEPNTTTPVHCSVLNCFLAYCPKCHEWHQADVLCLEDSFKKKCPRCAVNVHKDGGCNHITCPCGCHWCYACLAGFDTPDEVYRHMNKEHGALI